MGEVREGKHRSIIRDDGEIALLPHCGHTSVCVPKEGDHPRPAAAHQPTHSAELGLNIRGPNDLTDDPPSDNVAPLHPTMRLDHENWSSS